MMAIAASPPRRGRWLVGVPAPQAAPARLYCIPHAGGSPGEYTRWSDDLPGTEVLALQAPGHGARLTECPATRMGELAGAIATEVPFTEPFALFGHSLGGLVAFEVARARRERGLPLPARLFLSSCPPPQARRARSQLHRLPDGELLRTIEHRWGALPREVRDRPKLLAVTLRTFRADIEVFETYDYQPAPALDCPVTALAGNQEAAELAMEGWREHTRGGFSHHVLPGGHFYHRQHRQQVMKLVQETMPWRPE